MEDSSEQQHPATFDSMPMRWSEQHSYPHSYHGTPAQEYTGFGWGSPPLPMHSSTFSQSPPLRPSHQQLQPLMMPWPSMLGSQQTFYPPLLPQTQIGTTSPPTMTPISAGSSSRSGPSVRKTLSDDDRRRMCKYAEENPTAKQTEIGYLFGVERSTVSKVLRKKEIYLNQSQPKETPRSPPNKRSKARLPDIEKTLSAWVIKEQKKGSPITDDAIREQAYYFASIPGPENPASNPVNIPGWLEKFKQKHHVNRASKSKELRKDSVADSDNATVQSPTSPSDENLSSSSPETIYPTMDTAMAAEDAKPNNSNKRRKSPPSINTAFTDMGSTSTCFTPQLLSPTSPFFSPSSQISAGPLHSPLSQQQTFPALDHFMADSSPAEETLSSSSHPFLSSLGDTEDAESVLGRLGSIDEYMEDVIIDSKTINPDALTTKAPTREEAREALKIVVRYLEGEDGGRSEVQEGKLLGKLLGEKLRLRE
ncbi:hypothetical protein D6D21_09280 [Aureobasidium pullulans]|uniref:HTH CENPB-type domain-containing protein n=1 Tax=Aureobasidium pullulans TaxID=5580 RepID=A0A4S9AP79_AURPU|nr:hypothetical protein D6D21_09280 [Aureobasidium pullulans]THW81712.1 hypothetical protein D6D15_10550 [Aureobasidium pullulans]